MARKAKGPRLWLRGERRDALGRVTHLPTWLILDGSKQISTECDPGQRAEAENALLEYVEQRPIPGLREQFVYFVTVEYPNFPVKIGISQSSKMRLSALQTALPYAVKLLAMVRAPDHRFEHRLHRKFAHIKLRGEWFERTDELMNYIDCLANDTNDSREQKTIPAHRNA